MNDLGNLAYTILKYDFKEDASRFPISYISGWLDANIGELNLVLNESFSVDGNGNFQDSALDSIQKNIFMTMYEIHYYEKASREALRASVYPSSSDTAGDWTSIKEADTSIQRPSKTVVSNTLRNFAEQSQKKLNSLVYQYNVSKNGPIQVAGIDGFVPLNSYFGEPIYNSRSSN